ncbi:hypothetical protein [Streptomyces sp. NBC_01500]|uniref:hypothetical protein n=1 Tax=Streptomyces sp. NBC_01500 TaxID=2903886 RepID=UPI002255BF65|nr:hypothetical protein [Streptomyces sp. NBC_01500]MCX4553159.1 hypothetical protein [Streptomyces sp. NBC_01500]
MGVEVFRLGLPGNVVGFLCGFDRLGGGVGGSFSCGCLLAGLDCLISCLTGVFCRRFGGVCGLIRVVSS